MDDILDSLSRQGRKLKDRLKGRKHKWDRKRANTTGERGDPLGLLLQPEPHVAAGGHDGEGSRTSIDVPQDHSRDWSPQPESMPTDGSNDDSLKTREANFDKKKVSQGDSHLDPDVKIVVGSRLGREVKQVDPSPSAPSIPHSVSMPLATLVQTSLGLY